MFGTILRNEWRLWRRGLTGPLIAGALILATFYGGCNGLAWRRARRADAEGVRRAQAALLKEGRQKIAEYERSSKPAEKGAFLEDPRMPFLTAYRYGERLAELPPGPLEALSIGRGETTSNFARINMRPPHDLLGAEDLRNPLHLLEGFFDAAFAVVWLLPLAVVAMGFGMIANERETGRLKLLLAAPVEATTLLAAKAVLLWAVTVLAVMAATLPVALYDGGVGALPAWLFWTGAAAVYASFWVALAAAVNSFAASPAFSAVTLTAAWLVLVGVEPALLAVAAENLRPVPPTVERVGRRRALEINSPGGDKLVADFLAEHPGFCPVPGTPPEAEDDKWLTPYLVQNWRVEEALLPLDESAANARAARERLGDALRFLSPAALGQDALDEAAGSGTVRHGRFVVQAERFHRQWRDSWWPRIFRRETVASGELDRLPEFRFVEAAGPGAKRACVSLGTLLAMSAALSGWTFWRTRRLR